MYMGERVLTWVSFLLGEGLEISNLDPLTLLGTSNRQLNISKERQKPDSLGGEGPWGWSPKGLALLAQPPHTFSNLSAAQRPGNARNLLHSLLSPSLGPSGCWDFSSGNRILREECTDLKGTPLPHSHPPSLPDKLTEEWKRSQRGPYPCGDVQGTGCGGGAGVTVRVEGCVLHSEKFGYVHLLNLITL